MISQRRKIQDVFALGMGAFQLYQFHEFHQVRPAVYCNWDEALGAFVWTDIHDRGEALLANKVLARHTVDWVLHKIKAD